MISHEDKKDVARVLGAKTAKKVAHATDDSKSKALKRAIPEVSKREENKVLKSVQKKGYYASPAAQKALKKSKQDQDRFSKERAERYKREGLS